eukprot:scaffold20852_cov23-Cyclotella_meneghiniana.AAC.1
MMGSIRSRFHLGLLEVQNDNFDRAARHFIVAAKCGHDDSLEAVKQGFMKGLITKDDFEKTLREHKASQDETKSEQRDRSKVFLGQD